jgi:hypothetical protein
MSFTDFALIRPIAVTDAMLTSSSVPEPATGDSPDPAAWNGATAYVEGDRVTRTTVHKIYQRVNPGTTATAPELDTTTNWLEVGSTNRWRMFDQANESQTSKADSIIVTLTPAQLADSAAFLNLDGDTLRLQVASTSYDQTVALRDRTVVDWYSYFFEPFVAKTEVIFRDLPLLTSNVITFTLTKTGSIAKMGVALLGLAKTLGSTEYGASAGIIDYSTKSTNAFGNTTVVRRAYSKRMKVDLFIDAARVDEIQRLLADYRATPVVWIGAGNLYGALIVYGYYRSFDIVIAYFSHSKCRLEIEGLT